MRLLYRVSDALSKIVTRIAVTRPGIDLLNVQTAGGA